MLGLSEGFASIGRGPGLIELGDCTTSGEGCDVFIRERGDWGSVYLAHIAVQGKSVRRLLGCGR